MAPILSRKYPARMLLAIDVGNTQTHLGGFRGDALAEHWRFQTAPGRPATSSPSGSPGCSR